MDKSELKIGTLTKVYDKEFGEVYRGICPRCNVVCGGFTGSTALETLEGEKESRMLCAFCYYGLERAQQERYKKEAEKRRLEDGRKAEREHLLPKLKHLEANLPITPPMYRDMLKEIIKEIE